MSHPLEFLPAASRKPAFIALLALTAAFFGIFRVLDAPLHTEAAPQGIVSFELAGSARQSGAILASWRQTSLLASSVPGGNPDIPNIPYIYAAFELGLDYLFMPAYALTLSLGLLLASGRHGGILRRAGGWMGWAAFAAAGFDAVENYGLFRIMTVGSMGSWPQEAAACATAKFALLLAGILFALACWLIPRRN